MKPFNRYLVIMPLLMMSVLSSHAAQPSVWNSRGVGGGGALFGASLSPFDPNAIWIASDMSDMFTTVNLGQSWTTVPHQQLQVFRNSVVQFTNDPNILYVLSNGGGAYYPKKSFDGGKTWQRLTTDPTNNGAYNLYADPASTVNILISAQTQLYFSSDGGTTFHSVFTDTTGNGLFCAGAYFDGQNIYVGTNNGLLVSNNGGSTFGLSAISGIAAGEGIFSFAGAKQNGTARFFCVTYALAGLKPAFYPTAQAHKNFYTVDAGQTTWTVVGTGIPTGDKLAYVSMALNDISTAYVSGMKSSGNVLGSNYRQVYKTTDGGANWAAVFLGVNNQNIGTGWGGHQGENGWGWFNHATAFAVSPTDKNKVVINDLGWTHITTDGAATWKQIYTDVTHPMNTTAIKGSTYHGVGIEPTVCNSMVFCDAQNLFITFCDIMGNVSGDGGQSFSFYSSIAINSSYDLGEVVLHPSGTLYASYSSTPDPTYNVLNISDAQIDAGSGGILTSIDKGKNWTILHSFGLPVYFVALDPNNPNRLYASVAHSTQGGIYVSNDINNGTTATWTKLAAPPRTEGHPYHIAVLKDGTLVCTYSARQTTGFTASSGVFFSSDNGQTWIDRSHSGMYYWTKGITIDPADAAQNTWYVCTTDNFGNTQNTPGGFYKTTDRGQTWTKLYSHGCGTCTVSPVNANDLYLTTTVNGLQFCGNRNAATPTFTQDANYPFREPKRVYYNPFNNSEIWVLSHGNGMRVGTVTKLTQTINFAPLPDKTFGDAPITLNATATSNLQVSFSILSGPATLSGNTLTITGAGFVTVRASQSGDANYSAALNVDQSFNVTSALPNLTWVMPADITYGTALSATQLNAVAGVPGSFVYSPPAGTILNAGTNQPLSVNFTPDDTVHYASSSASVNINVLPKALIATANSGSRIYNTANPIFSGTLTGVVAGDGITASFLSSATLNTNAGVYDVSSPEAITPILSDPNTKLANYAVTLNKATMTIFKATPALSWPTPADIVFGTPLNNTQLNATASVPGAFSYTPGIGSTLNAGVGQALHGVFSPTDTGNYMPGSISVLITVQKSPQMVTFTPITDKVFGASAFALQAISSAGLPVAFSLVSGPATMNGSIVSLTGGGSVVIQADQAGDANYLAAAPVQRSFAVSVQPPHITSALTASVFRGAPFTYVITATGSPNITFNAKNLPGGLTFSGSTISGAPLAIGVASITLTSTNSAGTDTVVLQLTISRPVGETNHAPTFTSPPSAAPDPVIVGGTVTFSASATDLEGDTLTYAWDFGDGITAPGSQAQHAYVSPGVYTVQAAISDGTLSQTWSIMVAVSAKDVSGNNSFVIQSATMNFSFSPGMTNRDKITISGTLPVTPQAQATGTHVTIGIGAMRRNFTLSANGTGGDVNNRIKISGVKNGVFTASPLKFNFTMQKQTFLDQMSEIGFSNATIAKPGKSVDVPIAVAVGDAAYLKTVTMLFLATAGKSGSASMKK